MPGSTLDSALAAAGQRPATTDRFGFYGRTGRPPKVPVLAQAPPSSTSDGVATLRLYEPIDSWGGDWGISAREFTTALDELGDDVTEIRLHINSPGGEVFEGIAILNALRRHSARVVTVVDGLAASAASFIAMAGDEVVMAPNSELFVHDAWGIAIGDAEVMRDMAGRLDKLSDNIADVYARKAGGTVEDWRTAMLAETWYSAAEAVEAGLADRVEDEDADASEAAKNRWDLSVFAHAGRAAAPAPPLPAAARTGRTSPAPSAPPSPAASADGHTENTTQEESMALTDDLRQRLGIADENADEATILAALDEALAERADDKKIPEGHVVVPEARLKDLETSAAAGVQAAERLRQQDRKEFLDSVRTKFAPANRAAWEAEYDRDPAGTRKHFESAPDIVNLTEHGHAGSSGHSEDDETYVALFGAEKGA